jgi:hypothetical protein
MAANVLTQAKQDLIASLVQRELKETASLISCLTDHSNLAVKGSKQVSIPKMTSFTVGDRAFGAQGAESAALTVDVDTIALNKNKYILFGYDAADEMQSTIEYKIQAITRAAAAHGRQINDDILAELELVAGISVNGAAPADITASNILAMREFLMANFANMASVKFVIAADQERAMLELPEFSRYDYRGVGPSPIVNGSVGSVYGIPVILNQQIKAQQAFMIAPEGCGFAFQRSPAVGEDTDLRYGVNGMQVAVDCTYGVGGLELGEGSAGAGKSPLVAMLTD